MIEELLVGIRMRLEASDAAREKILGLSRTCIRISSSTIKNIHRGEFGLARGKIEENKRILAEIRKKYRQNNPEVYHKGYVLSCQQEFTESFILFRMMEGKPLSEEILDSLEVEDVAILLGLADVVGELRRYILDSMRKGNFSKVEDSLSMMDEIYQTLSAFDYPSGLIPGLRKKCDTARFLIERTRGDVTMGLQLHEFNENLKSKGA